MNLVKYMYAHMYVFHKLSIYISEYMISIFACLYAVGASACLGSAVLTCTAHTRAIVCVSTDGRARPSKLTTKCTATCCDRCILCASSCPNEMTHDAISADREINRLKRDICNE